MRSPYRDRLRTLGAPEDPVATDVSSPWSAMSLLKAIFARMQILTSVATVVSITTSSDTIAGTAENVAIVRVAPVTTDLALPTVVGRTRPLRIFDWSSGIVADHTITLTPVGAQTIMTLPSWQMVSTSVNLAGLTLYPSELLGGWFIAP